MLRAGDQRSIRRKSSQGSALRLADGMPLTGACILAGISVTKLAEWREKYPDLVADSAKRGELALQAIKAAGDRDWRVPAEGPKLSFASDYRGNTKIDISATASVSPVVLTEEE